MASAVVPAAGSASRFGGPKLIALVDGVPLLDRTLSTLLAAGIEEIVVIVPPDATWRTGAALLDDSHVRTVINSDPSPGMFSSIQLGVQAATSMPIAVVPADMPFIEAATIRALLSQAEGGSAIVSPRFGGRRGHPVILPADLRAAILAAPRTSSLNEVLAAHADRFVNVEVADPGVLRDVDAPADLHR